MRAWLKVFQGSKWSKLLALAFIFIFAGIGSYFVLSGRAAASCTTTLSAPTNGTTDLIGPTVVAASDGDTICLNSGTYPSFTITKSHHNGYVTITAAQGASPVLGGGGSRIGNSSFLKFQNLKITDQITVQDADPTLYGNGPTSHDFQFINNDISGTSGPRFVSFNNDTITNITITGNNIHDIEAPGISWDSATQKCVGSAGTDGQGITLSGTDNVLIKDNVFKSIAWHFIQGGGGSAGVTVDHNMFTGPQPSNTLNCAHMNVWQVWAGGSNDTFSNNVVVGSASQGTTPVAANSLMFENGQGGANCSVTMANTVVNNNLFVDQNESYEYQIGTTTNAIVTNNTIVGSAYGTLVASSHSCGSSTNVTEANNIVTNNTNGSLNFSFGGCTVSATVAQPPKFPAQCLTDYNVSQDATAGPYDGTHYGSLFGDMPGTTHYVAHWTPSWVNTTWTPSSSSPSPPSGYYKPVGLPFQAGYQGSVGPESSGSSSIAPSVTLTASPASINPGSASTLNWSSTNTTSCSASSPSGWTTSQTTSGSQSVSPNANTTYTITCTGPGGSASAYATVTIGVVNPAPTVTLTANPNSINSGSSSTLNWSTTNATSCTAGGAWSGSQSTSGNFNTGALTTNETYSITCTGPGGSASASAAVTVTTPPPAGTPIIGSNTVQSSNDSDASGHAEAFKQTATSSGQTNTVNVYVNSGSTASQVVAGIYSDSNGAPGSLLAQGSLTNPVSGMWNNIKLGSSANLTSGTTYWLALLGTGGQLSFKDGSNGTSQTSGSSTLAAMPSSWTAGQNYNSGPVSAYAVASSTVDTTPPTVSLTSPVNGAKVSGNVTLTASATDNAKVSKVEFDIDGSVLAVLTSSPYTTAWDASAVTNGSHTITVKATDSSGNVASTSSQVTVNNPDTTPPSTPAGLTGKAVSPTEIDLTWNASTDNVGVTGYYVERNGSVVATVTGTTYNDVGLVANTSYSYNVVAFDGASNASALSNTAIIKTPSPPDTTPPSVPTGLNATAANSSQVNLSWNASTDDTSVAGYNVYRNGVKINTNLITTTTFGDATLSPGTTYSYSVNAVDGAGNSSAQTALVSVTTPQAPGSLILGSNASITHKDSNPTGTAEAFQIKPTSSGSLASLYLYVDSTTTAKSAVVGIYKDNSGAPGSLLAQKASTSLQLGAWNRFSVPSSQLTAGNVYWLAILNPGSGKLVFHDSGSGSKDFTSKVTNLTTLPTNWASGKQYNNSPAEVYGTN